MRNCGISGENVWKNMMRDIEEIKNQEIKEKTK
jgi:hypothetical protein